MALARILDLLRFGELEPLLLKLPSDPQESPHDRQKQAMMATGGSLVQHVG